MNTLPHCNRNETLKQHMKLWDISLPARAEGIKKWRVTAQILLFFILVIIGDTVPCKLICFSEIGKVLESLNLLVLPEKPVLDRSEHLTGRMHVDENALVLKKTYIPKSLSLDPQCKNCQAPSDVVKDTRPLCGCTRKDTWCKPLLNQTWGTTSCETPTARD